jgi:hypothetical protein
MGIRTPVASVRGSHDWPDYTIAAQLLNNLGDIFTYSLLRPLSCPLPLPYCLFSEMDAMPRGIGSSVVVLEYFSRSTRTFLLLIGKPQTGSFPHNNYILHMRRLI